MKYGLDLWTCEAKQFDRWLESTKMQYRREQEKAKKSDKRIIDWDIIRCR